MDVGTQVEVAAQEAELFSKLGPAELISMGTVHGNSRAELFSKPEWFDEPFDEAHEEEEEEIRSEHDGWMWQQSVAEYREQYERDHAAQGEEQARGVQLKMMTHRRWKNCVFPKDPAKSELFSKPRPQQPSGCNEDPDPRLVSPLLHDLLKKARTTEQKTVFRLLFGQDAEEFYILDRSPQG